MTVDVAVIGSPFLDLTFEGLPRTPQPGEEILARELHATPGGTGMQAIGLARLGLSVAIIGPLGAGFGADVLRRTLEDEGVRVAGDAASGRTATTVLLSTTAGVAMATVLGEGEPSPDDVRAIGAGALVMSLGRLPLAPPEAAIYAVTGGLELGNVAEGPLERLNGVRACIANAREVTRLTGEDDPMEGGRVVARSGTTAVVTMGAGGALAVHGTDVVSVPAPRVDVVDATGAGDLFVAAYVWADLCGAALEDRLRWATLYASLSVRAPTALAGAVRLEDLSREGSSIGLSSL